MLQQLNTLIAAKPSEKATICQGERSLQAIVAYRTILGSIFVYIYIYIKVFISVLFLFFLLEEAEDPACVPIFWISKWVDYSDKYGLGEI